MHLHDWVAPVLSNVSLDIMVLYSYLASIQAYMPSPLPPLFRAYTGYLWAKFPVRQVLNPVFANGIGYIMTLKRRAKRKHARSRLKAAPSAAAATTTTALAIVVVVATLSSANHSHAAMTAYICPSKATLASRGAMGGSLFFSALTHEGDAPRRGKRHGDVRFFSPSETRLVRSRERFLGWSGKAGKACCSGAKNR